MNRRRQRDLLYGNVKKKWQNHSFIYFSTLESDFRLLNKPFKPVVYVDNTCQLVRGQLKK